MLSFAEIGERKSQNGEWFSLPSSKSISNRLLIIRFLAGSALQVRNLSSSDDTVLLERCLEKIKGCFGAAKQPFGKSFGCFDNSVSKNEPVELECGNAGTTCRFLTALLSITQGRWSVNADGRMEHRPLLPLIEVLKSLGADIETANENHIFPLQISGKPLQGGQRVKLPPDLSSQFVSALALIAPYMERGLEIKLSESQVSMPYVRMTVEIMRKNGAEVLFCDNVLKISPKPYVFRSSEVEADWSAAAFAYALVAVNEIEGLKIKGLIRDSLQGDSIVENWFAEFFDVKTDYMENFAVLSCRKGLSAANKCVNLDFKDCPDLFLPLLAAAALRKKPFVFSSLETLVHKESDRLHNALTELAKFGIHPQLCGGKLLMRSEDYPDFSNLSPIETATYNDHRMAMAFSLFASRFSCVRIENPDCVSKSFPAYWEKLGKFFFVRY